MTFAAFWFTVLAVLWTGFLLLEGFDFGVGMLHGVVSRDEDGRVLAIRTISPVWDGNEVWLIVALSVMFGAFAPWYATWLSGFYPIVIVVLVALILRGVSFEFRAHSASDRGRRFWDGALTGGSLIVPLGLGIMLGSLLGGVPINAAGDFAGNLGDLFRPYAVATGLTITLICLLLGSVFLAFRTSGDVRLRASGLARVLGPVTALVVIGWVTWTRISVGGDVVWSVAELAAVLAAVTAAVLVRGHREGAAFAAASTTMVAVVVSLFSELYPNVMVSTLGAANNLTVSGTVGSDYTLRIMTIVLVVLLPIVLAYQGWTYHVFRKRLGGSNAPGAVFTEPPSPNGNAPATADSPAVHRDDAVSHRADTATWTTHPVARFATWTLAWVAAWSILTLRAALSLGADAAAGPPVGSSGKP